MYRGYEAEVEGMDMENGLRPQKGRGSTGWVAGRGGSGGQGATTYPQHQRASGSRGYVVEVEVAEKERGCFLPWLLFVHDHDKLGFSDCGMARWLGEILLKDQISR